MSEINSDDLMRFAEYELSYERYMICDDALVSFWKHTYGSLDPEWGAYTGLTSPPFTDMLMRRNGHVDSLCPTSGRYVYFDDDHDDGSLPVRTGSIVVVDLF